MYNGYNANSIRICYEGGLNCWGHPTNTQTSELKTSLRLLVHRLREQFPGCQGCRYQDLSPDLN